MSNTIVEVCCGSVEDVVNARRGKADRVELNSGLFFGGLTPSVGALRLAKEKTNIPIICMVRPREAGFCYSKLEFETMLEDASALLKAGADGIAFGILTKEGRIDIERNQRMVEVIGEKDVVFHRAFDVINQPWQEAMDQLMELGVNRILTSGAKKTALEGAENIKDYIEYGKRKIEILPGGNIRNYNVNEIISRTGCNQIHTSGGEQKIDQTASFVSEIKFTGEILPEQAQYKITNQDIIAEIVKTIVE